VQSSELLTIAIELRSCIRDKRIETCSFEEKCIFIKEKGNIFHVVSQAESRVLFVISRGSILVANGRSSFIHISSHTKDSVYSQFITRI